MTETLRLSYIVDDQEIRSEIIRESAKLDAQTWEWLKGAFVAIGFHEDNIEEFFEP